MHCLLLAPKFCTTAPALSAPTQTQRMQTIKCLVSVASSAPLLEPGVLMYRRSRLCWPQIVSHCCDHGCLCCCSLLLLRSLLLTSCLCSHRSNSLLCSCIRLDFLLADVLKHNSTRVGRFPMPTSSATALMHFQGCGV